MKLLEGDLDSAEDKLADFSSKSNDQESQIEELTRDSKQLNNRIATLEGMSFMCMCVLFVLLQ